MTKIEVYRPPIFINFFFEKIEIKMAEGLWRFLWHYLRTEDIALEAFAHRAELYWFGLWEQGYPISRNSCFVNFVRICFEAYAYKARGVSNDWERTGDQPTYPQFSATRRDFANQWFRWRSVSGRLSRKWNAAAPQILSGVSSVRVRSFSEMEDFLRRHDRQWLVIPVGPLFIKLQV